MSKYIDAERLKAEIEKMREINRKALEAGHIKSGVFHGRAQTLNYLFEFIDSHQQEHPELPEKGIAEYYYHKGVYEGLSQGRADAIKILDEFAKSKADPIIVIKQQEQQEVELEKEMDRFFEEMPIQEHENIFEDTYQMIARHFYELGKNSK